MRLLPVLLLCLAAPACGYKAPLYLPKAKAEAGKPAVAITPEPAPDRPVPAQAAPAAK
jgi:hypothetical protein